MTTPVSEMDVLLTLDEVAAALRATKPLVMKYLHDEACPLREVRLGRYIRIPRSSYDALLDWLAA